jgi:lipoprotein-anchoring transpeptidase ErfK/SrfK
LKKISVIPLFGLAFMQTEGNLCHNGGDNVTSPKPRKAFKTRNIIMKKSQIQIGNRYQIQLGKNTTEVTIMTSDDNGTWLCQTESGKILKVKNAERFLKEIKPKVKKAAPKVKESKSVTKGKAEQPVKRMGPKPNGKMSVLDAARQVIIEAGRPMRVQEIMETATRKNYCVVTSKTPFNTFNGGIRNEIIKKGEASRFVWVDKGLFDIAR